MQGNLFQLREVKVAGTLGAHSWLEPAGQATICYVVQDEAIHSAVNWNETPTLSLETECVFQTGRASSDRHTQVLVASTVRALDMRCLRSCCC